jgi:hypothetical protein
MGYTNYTRNTPVEHPQERWDMFVEAVKHVHEESGVQLAGWDGTGRPVFNSDKIRFNGIEDDSCETFAIDRVMDT